MQLSSIEYNVIMQAINDAKCAVADGDFIDPYGEGADEYTEELVLSALDSVENKIMSANIPN